MEERIDSAPPGEGRNGPALIVRPSRDRYSDFAGSEGGLSQRAAARLPFALPWLVLAAAFLVYRIATTPGQLFAATAAGCLVFVGLVFGVAISARELTFKNTRIELFEDRIVYRGIFGLSRAYRRDQLKRVLMRWLPSYRGTDHPIVLFIGPKNRVIFRLWREFWEGRDLERLYMALGIGPDSHAGIRTTAWRLRQEAKGAIPPWSWILWNPIATSLCCTLVLAVLFVVYILLLLIVTGGQG